MTGKFPSLVPLDFMASFTFLLFLTEKVKIIVLPLWLKCMDWTNELVLTKVIVVMTMGQHYLHLKKQWWHYCLHEWDNFGNKDHRHERVDYIRIELREQNALNTGCSKCVHSCDNDASFGSSWTIVHKSYSYWLVHQQPKLVQLGLDQFPGHRIHY